MSAYGETGRTAAAQRASSRPTAARMATIFVRYLLPALIALAGFVVLVVGGSDRLDGGLGLLVAAACTSLFNLAYRVSADDREREAEESARDFYSRHGHWPDEAPPAER